MTTAADGRADQLTQVCAMATTLANRMRLEYATRGTASMHDAVALLKAARLLESYDHALPDVVAEVMGRLGAEMQERSAPTPDPVREALPTVVPTQPDDLSAFTFGDAPPDSEPRNVLQKLFRSFRAFERA